jgi:hypothetical protein
MKKYAALSIITLSCLVLLIIMAFSNKDEKTTASEPYILVEIYEVPSYPNKGIHIHYGNGKREVIPFKNMELEYHDEAGDLTLDAINNLVAQGYEIESTASGLAQSGMITKVFMRKK